MMTMRDAETALAACGIGRRHARRVLVSGLAGVPRAERNRLLFAPEAVAALVERPHVADEVIDRHRASGLFVGRRDVDVTVAPDEQRAAAAGEWRLGVGTVVCLTLWLRRHRMVPFVATVAGFVAFGADLVGLHRDPVWHPPSRPGDHRVPSQDMPRARLRLEPPGAWFGDFAGRRLVTGPGQPALVIGVRTQADPLRPTRG